MARTAEQIQADIITQVANTPDLSYVDSNGITQNITANNSKRAIWRLWTFIIATALAVEEQLNDLYILFVEAIVARSSAASTLWVQDKFFKFQYDAADPQIIQLINTIPQYLVVDETKRIVTACSVTTALNNSVLIKLAKGNPYEALAVGEVSAAQDMINTIGVAGINYVVTSGNADKIYIDATIYYKGQYSSVISQLVQDSLNGYLQTLSQINFNGSLKMSDLEAVIRNVTGVNDVIVNNVIGRPDSPTPADPRANSSGFYYVQNATLMQRLFQPSAGYIVGETVVGYTFADSFTFIAQ